MFNKLSGKTLAALLVALLVIYLLTTFWGSDTNRRTFPDTLLQLDSNAVEYIIIKAKSEGHHQYELVLKDSIWRVGRGDRTFPTEAERVSQVIAAFKELKPQRLAGKDRSSWEKFEVNDSLGTLVSFGTASGELQTIMVGKFNYDQATRRGTSYIRAEVDERTFAVDGFLRMAVDQPMDNWRNRSILQGSNGQDSWNELKFTYPADSGFVLTRQNDMNWLLNGAASDSLAVEDYIRSISNLQSVDFVDDIEPPASPLLTLRLTSAQSSAETTIEAFEVGGEHGFLLRSSINPESYFSGSQGELLDKIFKSAAMFATRNAE